MHRHRFLLFSLAGVALLVTTPSGCDLATDPKAGTKSVSFSVSTAESIGASLTSFARYAFDGTTAAASTSGAPLVLGVNSDTLRIDSVRIVLAQVTLDRKSKSL